jgi:AbiV family abortive infection protein
MNVMEFVLRGGWFTLEQAGRLVTDATMLFRVGSSSTAAGLALLSREELAKSRRLFALWIKAHRGAQISLKEVDLEIDMSHADKQRHGASSFSIPVDETTLELLTHGREDRREEYEDVTRRLHLTFERLRKRAPDTRTRQRERAFYVDTEDGRWLRPAEMPSHEIETIIVEARNDYWQHRDPGRPALARDIEALQAALAAWSEKPELPPMEWTTRL